MADNAFDRTPIHPLEKPLGVDVNQLQSQLDRSLREVLYQQWKASGFLRDGLQVVQNSPAALSVILKAGLAFQIAATDTPGALGGIAGVDDFHPYKPIVLANDLTVAVPTPPGANSRIDLLEVRYNRQLDNQMSRQVLDFASGAFAPASLAKTLDFTVDGTLAYYSAAATPTTALAYKSGVVSGSPVAPATDTGYMAIAQITVASGVATIVTANIADQRALLVLGWYLGRQKFTTAGAFTYTPTPGTRRIRVRMVGGGGGGGGAQGAANKVAAAGGGASGSYLDFSLVSADEITGGAGTIGAGGGGGAGAGGSAGSGGGNTTGVFNGGTYIAQGGGAGAGRIALDTVDGIQGGVANGYTSPTTPDQVGGQAGGSGFGSFGATVQYAIGGSGGSTPMGNGASGGDNAAGAALAAANGHGGGGGGAGSSNGSNFSGSAGADGAVFVDEWAG